MSEFIHIYELKSIYFENSSIVEPRAKVTMKEHYHPPSKNHWNLCRTKSSWLHYMRKQHPVRALFLKAIVCIINRSLKMGPTSRPVKSYSSLFKTKPDPLGLNKSLKSLNTSERERAKRWGPKRVTLNFQLISYSLKRLILILKKDLTLFVPQVDDKFMRYVIPIVL